MGATLDYSGGGVQACGYYAAPLVSAPRGAVLVIHEAPGLGAHVKRRVDALSERGFAALATDLYGDGRLASGPDEARSWVDGLKSQPDVLIARLEAALDALAAKSAVGDNLAAIGYCFGGWCALELARAGAPLRSTSIFHGAVASRRDASAIQGSVLICVGDVDPFVPASQLIAFGDEMRAAKIDYQLCLYSGIGHGFSDPNGPVRPGFAYDAVTDRRSWASFMNLLDEHSPMPGHSDHTG